MAVPLLDLAAQYNQVGAEIEAAVIDALRSQKYILGPRLAELEAACAKYCETPFALGVSSGSDALILALMALDIGPGDEVITTPFSFFATAGAVHRVGAVPVFADIEAGTFNLDPAAIEAVITSNTKAIIVVHLFGQCADMDPIMEIASRHGIHVIEDAAQAIGARYRGQAAGSIGTVGCFSFFPSKNLGGAGDGGLVTSKDLAIHERMKKLRNHGSSPKYYHQLVGGNFRLDELQAAILLVKLRHLDSWTAARQAHAAAYRTLLKPAVDSGKIILPVEAPERRHIWNQFTIRAPGQRDAIVARLRAADIGTEVYYPRCLHLQECFAYLGAGGGDFPVAEKAALEVFSIPVFPELTHAQMVEVAQAICA